MANALKALGYERIRGWVSVGALVGMISSLLVFQYGQARIWFAMSRDGLLPRVFSRVHPVHKTPHVSTWIAGLAVGIPAGHLGHRHLRRPGQHRHAVRLHHRLGRRDRAAPQASRTGRAASVFPVRPWLPCVSIVCCLVLMLGLPLETWLRFFVWLLIGFAIYFPFGRRHSALAKAGR